MDIGRDNERIDLGRERRNLGRDNERRDLGR